MRSPQHTVHLFPVSREARYASFRARRRNRISLWGRRKAKAGNERRARTVGLKSHFGSRVTPGSEFGPNTACGLSARLCVHVCTKSGADTPPPHRLCPVHASWALATMEVRDDG